MESDNGEKVKTQPKRDAPVKTVEMKHTIDNGIGFHNHWFFVRIVTRKLDLQWNEIIEKK